MDLKLTTQNLDLEIQIEELEPKIAPDGSEQVMPLPVVGHHHG